MCSTFWGITLCSVLKVSRRFGGTLLYTQDCYMLHAGFLVGLFFAPENEGGMLLRNVGLHGVYITEDRDIKVISLL
jgi:hypothetical protein